MWCCRKLNSQVCLKYILSIHQTCKKNIKMAKKRIKWPVQFPRPGFSLAQDIESQTFKNLSCTLNELPRVPRDPKKFESNFQQFVCLIELLQRFCFELGFRY